MIARRITYGLVVLTMLTGWANASAGDSNYAQVLRGHEKRIRGMVIAIIAAMPEDKYGYRPTKDVRSFLELSHHMIEDTYAHAGYVMGHSREDSVKLAEKFKDAKSRAEIVEGLNAAFDFSDQMLGSVTDQNAMDIVTVMRGGQVTRVEAALQLFEDQMDHYGNFVVYLRINGVVPPDTAERQQQLKQQGPARQEMQGMGHAH